MTEIPENIDWTCYLIALLIAPLATVALLLLPCFVFPPFAFIAIPVAIFSLTPGYVSYLMLAGPMMVLAQMLGLDHPIFHAAIGYGAVSLVPAANALGLPFIAAPDTVEMGLWFGPLWCACCAFSYTQPRCSPAEAPQPA